MPEDSRVIQVTNVAPGATRDQMKTLFSYVGKIDDVQLYPADETIELATSKICYVKFFDPSDVNVSLHLTNTVFIDRALIVSPLPDGRIPDETTALALIASPGFTGVTHPSKADELTRTVYVGNVNGTSSPEAIMDYFSQAGEIKYLRMAGDEGSSTRAAFIEFTEQSSVMNALAMSGQMFADRSVHVQQALNTIIKPAIAGVVASSREVEEAMRKVNDAQSLISAAVDPDLNGEDRSRSKSKSKRSHRSRSKKRSRSRSHHSRKRSSSRSHHSSRRRSRSRSHRRRSPSPRSGRGSGRRSRSRDHKSKRRSRSRSPRRSSRRSRSGSKRKRTPPREPKSSSRRSRSRSISKLDKEGSVADKDRSKNGDRKESSRRRSRSKSKSPKGSLSSSSRRDKEKASSSGGGGRRDRSREREKDSSSSKRASEKDRDRDRESDRSRKNGSERSSGGERDREKERESGDKGRDKDKGRGERGSGDKGRESGRERERSRERERDREPKEGRDPKSSRRNDRDDAREEEVEVRSNVSRKEVCRDYDEEERDYRATDVQQRGRGEESEEGSDVDNRGRKQERYSSKSGDDRSPANVRGSGSPRRGQQSGDINFTQMDMDVDSDE